MPRSSKSPRFSFFKANRSDSKVRKNKSNDFGNMLTPNQSPLTPILQAKVLKEGYLFKQGEKHKTWNKRYTHN